MKYKKYSYILALILMLIVGINGVYAETSKQCFYVSDKNDLRVAITLKNYGNNDNSPWFAFMDDYIYSEVNKIGTEPLDEKISIENDFSTSSVCSKNNEKCTTLNPYYESFDKFYKTKEPNCPKYVVLKRYTYQVLFWPIPYYNAYLTDYEEIAKKITDNANSLENTYAVYADLQPNMTEEEYFNGMFGTGSGGSTEIPDEKFCDSLFGDPTDDGAENDIGDDEAASIAYLINTVMSYVRIIVPILIIVLGMFDFGKAVVAGKEDDMKKAQSTFIKRVLIGVCVFFVPLLVNIVMDLAEMIWAEGNTACQIGK